MKTGAESMYDKLESILIKSPEDAFLNQKHIDENYEKFNYLGRPIYENVLSDFASFEAILKENVRNIYYLPKDSTVGIDSIYAHDPLEVTEKGAIYFQMGKDLRKSEPEATRKYLESIGIPTFERLKGSGTMEGGDLLWVDKKTVAIGLSDRTNEEGIRQFRDIMGEMVDEVIPVPLPYDLSGKKKVMHLSGAIHIVAKDVAVIYPRYMPAKFRSYLKERGFNFIEVSEAEKKTKGTNVLSLSPKKCMMVRGNKGVKSGIEEHGIEVLEFNGADLNIKGDGGPTCLTAVLLRVP
jgi:N-dimethylarginine dimethylaminohydrolase